MNVMAEQGFEFRPSMHTIRHLKKLQLVALCIHLNIMSLLSLINIPNNTVLTLEVHFMFIKQYSKIR